MRCVVIESKVPNTWIMTRQFKRSNGLFIVAGFAKFDFPHLYVWCKARRSDVSPAWRDLYRIIRHEKRIQAFQDVASNVPQDDLSFVAGRHDELSIARDLQADNLVVLMRTRECNALSVAREQSVLLLEPVSFDRILHCFEAEQRLRVGTPSKLKHMIVLNIDAESFPVLGVRQIFQVPNQNCAVCEKAKKKKA